MAVTTSGSGCHSVAASDHSSRNALTAPPEPFFLFLLLLEADAGASSWSSLFKQHLRLSNERSTSLDNRIWLPVVPLHGLNLVASIDEEARVLGLHLCLAVDLLDVLLQLCVVDE